MSIRTIYTCEKCGAEQLTGDQFWTVGVQANHHAYSPQVWQFVTGKSLQVCRPCLESFGIHVQTKPNEEPAPVPTVEELIREIIERCSS